MILFENVTKKYRGTAKPALDGIDLKIDRGEFVFIVGASGSGKSSCLRLILREDQPSVGKIHVLGQDLSKISSRKVPYFRRSLGTVFQDFRLLTNKTVYDNVAFTLQVIGKSRGFIQEAVPDTLEMVGLANKAKRFPHELSGGEQQRVAIARAIVNKPAILLADEPTGNLDPATSLGIMQLLRSINAAGTTVVMATHEATFVDIMQQRVVELSQGVIVRDEQGGGYGETASIPIADLSEAGAQVLRTSEAVVRAALQPDGTPVVADPAPVVLPEATPEPPAAPEASVFEEPRPFEGEGDDDEDLDVTRRAGEEPAIPSFLQQGQPMDPVQMSETGNLAQHLGLDRKDDDEQTDVGPVR
ncbi:cell division ATP-binding protein FtsE [Leucobacter viscericola]|uniref:Cell division ATP-binding protein FtsE n=1 Tax=Leucobacter viscericola TaxID=2714935 RepID=A0A6G7XDF9_9MICO|nr:cell division ATP-binding protein FtsE [Leucobacter viscericola]QIK62479.1 cell division ATP-binding protein FtsE [Leucobacter viscericola]